LASATIAAIAYCFGCSVLRRRSVRRGQIIAARAAAID
jgi:hypothetical protein